RRLRQATQLDPPTRLAPPRGAGYVSAEQAMFRCLRPAVGVLEPMRRERSRPAQRYRLFRLRPEGVDRRTIQPKLRRRAPARQLTAKDHKLRARRPSPLTPSPRESTAHETSLPTV